MFLKEEEYTSNENLLFLLLFFRFMKLRVNANAVIQREDGKILFIDIQSGPFKGYCIPGGGVEPGEFSFEAVEREIEEETGIRVEGLEAYGFGEMMSSNLADHRVMMLLQGRGFGEPVKKDTHSPVWLSLEEAEKNLNLFTKHALEVWQGKKKHFSVRDHV